MCRRGSMQQTPLKAPRYLNFLLHYFTGLNDVIFCLWKLNFLCLFSTLLLTVIRKPDIEIQIIRRQQQKLFASLSLPSLKSMNPTASCFGLQPSLSAGDELFSAFKN